MSDETLARRQSNLNLVSPHTAKSDRVNTMGLWEGALTLRGLCPVCACVQSSTQLMKGLRKGAF